MVETYYPTLLDQSVQAYSQEIKTGIYGLAQKKITSLNSSEHTEEVRQSLSTFCYDMNRGALGELVKHYSSVPEDDGSFFLTSYGQQGHNYLGPNDDAAHFYADGKYSLVLGFKQRRVKDPLWIGMCSFSSAQEAFRSVRRREKIPVVKYPADSPAIEQLQSGFYNLTHKQQELSDSLRQRRVRWEKAVLDITILWAEAVGCPAVYVIPAEYNPYLCIERDARLEMRYNITSKRMGFKPDARDIWKIDIDQPR